MLKDLKLTLDLYETIIPRIIDISLGGVNWYSFDTDESKGDYERFIINENLAKPSLKRIEEEFEEYKAELIAQKEAEMSASWEYMSDIRLAINELALDIKNPAKEFERILKEEDESFLQNLVNAYDIAIARLNEENERQSKKDIGQRVRQMCDNALDVIIGYNVTRSLSKQDQDKMKKDYADIFQALKDYQPATAKALIEAVTVDGVLTTQSMKDDILKEL